jgi:IclR family transcriptional regulator, acetate operon repressor
MVESKQVQSVSRALDLLEHVTLSSDEVALTDLARKTGLQTPTAHRLLQTLVAREWLVQSPKTSRYRPSNKLLAIAGGVEARSARLRATARPHLEMLRDASGESTNLVVLDGRATVYVDQAPSPRPIRMFAEIGARVPAYASGAGKAMLAFGGPEALDALFAGGPLERLTAHTLTDRQTLERELERVRERRYAVDDEEYEPGISCVAAPILSADGAGFAALSISAPSTRLRAADPDRLGALIAEHASRITSGLALTAGDGRR